MKKNTELSFTYEGKTSKQIERLLRTAGITSKEHDELDDFVKMVTISIADSDSRIAILQKLLKQQGIRPELRTRISFEQDDLLTARFLCVNVTLKTCDESGPENGTEYDLSGGCLRCGSGCHQTSALRIAKSKLPKSKQIAAFSQGEIALAESMFLSLNQKVAIKNDFRQIEDRKSGSKLPWYQWYPETTMPKMDMNKTQGILIEEQCPKCRRDGHYFDTDRDFVPTYKKSVLMNIGSAHSVSTWECFGRSNLDKKNGYRVGFAVPQLLVDQNVYRAIAQLRISGISFVPVYFE